MADPQAPPRLVDFEGKTQVFPADFTDAEISAALKAIPKANAPQAPKAKTWTDMAVGALPAVGATVGGTIGAIGGTAFGMGIGGVPGAAAGAGLGGATGEAAKQLINRLRGAEAPSTAGEAASAIGREGAIDAAVTGAIGGAGSLARPYVGAGLQKLGGAIEASPSVRQLAGKAISATGRLVDSADTTTQKLVLDATDVTRIRDLMKAGVSQSEAVKRVWNFKVQNIVGSWK